MSDGTLPLLERVRAAIAKAQAAPVTRLKAPVLDAVAAQQALNVELARELHQTRNRLAELERAMNQAPYTAYTADAGSIGPNAGGTD